MIINDSLYITMQRSLSVWRNTYNRDILVHRIQHMRHRVQWRREESENVDLSHNCQRSSWCFTRKPPWPIQSAEYTELHKFPVRNMKRLTTEVLWDVSCITYRSSSPNLRDVYFKLSEYLLKHCMGPSLINRWHKLTRYSSNKLVCIFTAASAQYGGILLLKGMGRHPRSAHSPLAPSNWAHTKKVQKPFCLLCCY